MATYYMFFPFLTCEVKCGAGGLDMADRQNAHSMTLAVRGIIHLFRQLGREGELHRRDVAFSISHNHEFVKLHGHYAEIYGQTTKYYRHTIKSFDITNEEGRSISYRFTRAIYTEWAPQHLRRICSAIDLLPLISESALASLAVATPLQSLESGGSLDTPSESFSIDSSPSSDDASSSEQSAAKNKHRKRKRRKQK